MRLELADLQLEAYYVRELSITIRPGLENDVKLALAAGLHIQPGSVMTTPPYSVEVDIDSGKNTEDPARYRIFMHIYSDESVITKERAPYRFSLRLVGYFRVDNPVDSAVADLLIIRNAAMILYSAGREIIASATARGPVPALVLPTYSFMVDDDIAKLTARKELSTPPKSAPKPTKSKSAKPRRSVSKKR
jgi:preprotein translocase subunit SecB